MAPHVPEGACCAHDHDCEENECSAQWTLHQHVDTHKVRALNERVTGSCKDLFRSWDDRLDTSKSCLSEEDDPELIIHIPFTSDVKIKSICIVGGSEGSSPSHLKVFLNREDIDFTNANDVPPAQEWELVEDTNGVMEYNTKYTKFQSIATITMYFPESFNGDYTQLHFIGFKGEHTANRRDKVVQCVYESQPNLEDHKTETENQVMKSIF